METDRDSFEERLMPGERIIWSGHPAHGFLLTSWDLFLIPFSVFWCFAVIQIGSATWKAGAIGLFEIAFFFAGVFMTAGRFVADAWVRRRTAYALTNLRALIWRASPFGTFQAVTLSRSPDVVLTERKNGCGTIRFGQPTGIFDGRTATGIWMPSLASTPQFLRIPDARRVFELAQSSPANSG